MARLGSIDAEFVKSGQATSSRYFLVEKYADFPPEAFKEENFLHFLVRRTIGPIHHVLLEQVYGGAFGDRYCTIIGATWAYLFETYAVHFVRHIRHTLRKHKRSSPEKSLPSTYGTCILLYLEADIRYTP